MTKLLLTGAGGFLGANVAVRAGVGVEVHAVVREHGAPDKSGVISHTLDLRNGDALGSLFTSVLPDVVVHTAAMSDIDYCEVHQAEAERVNVGVTAALAARCRESGARLIFLSTDAVFDGTRGLYTEEDEPHPLNVYARTKVAAEQAVRQTVEDWIVVRPALILGLAVAAAGNSFLHRMMRSLAQSQAVAFPKDELRTPVDVVTLSRAILELAGRPDASRYNGVLHLAGNDVLSRFDMARRIATRLGYSEELIIDRKPVVSSGRAPRPADVSLDNHRAGNELRTPMQGLNGALDLVLGA